MRRARKQNDNQALDAARPRRSLTYVSVILVHREKAPAARPRGRSLCNQRLADHVQPPDAAVAAEFNFTFLSRFGMTPRQQSCFMPCSARLV